MTGTNIRARLAADPELGAGNVLPKLFEHGADPEGPGAAFDVPVDGLPAWQELTLGRLRERVTARAAWWHERGIGPRDPVAVYVSSSADCLLNFLALTWLGAIPALMNQYIPGDIAAEYIRRLRGVGLVTDAEHRERLAGQDLAVAVHADAAEVGTGDPGRAPAAYRHHADDPIAITHSSGTTRMPTAVVHSNGSLFAAMRLFRLSAPRGRGSERILSALPAAHAAGISALNMALCFRSDLLFLSTQNDGAAVVNAIERWKPTGVFGFAATWAQLAREDLGARDLDSVSLWFNTGDCAHEPHIRHLVAAGSRQTVTREGVRRTPGSSFVDGLGSTEMGHSAFHITHSPGTERYGRCVGVPHGFADVALLDTATGREVPVGQVGHLGLKAPTLAPGYWNDSGATYRNRLGGYYLTGDLLYRDEEGYYFHVDRAVDAVDLGGEWLYTAMSEERILAACPDVHDCTVVSLEVDGRVVTDVLLAPHATADPDADRTAAVRSALTDAAAATLREVVVISEDDLIVGPTGKVRKFLMRQRHRALMAETGTSEPVAQAQAAEPLPAPKATERVPVDFAGEGEGADEMSWGMLEIWYAMQRQRSALPIGGRAPLDAGTTVADLVEELRYLMSRFPSMRTRLRFHGEGDPTQELFASGTIALEVYDAGDDDDPGEVAAAVEAEYRRAEFDYAGEWPVRMGVVRHHGRPAHLVTVMHHLVSDALGGALMLREVKDRVTTPVSGMQQLEQARWQRTPAGQRQNERVLRHWEGVLRTVPARQLPGPTDPRSPRHWTCLFRSPALTEALPVIAARTGSEVATVLMALYAAALHRVTGISPVMVRPVVGNRFRPALADVVCMVAQAGVCVLDVRDAAFEQVVERAGRGTLSAYKYAYFHPGRLRELIDRFARERGEDINVDCFFNDRSTHLPPEEGRLLSGEELAESLRKALGETTFTWTDRRDIQTERLFVSIDDAPGSLRIEINADTHFISPADTEALARGMEEIAVRAAMEPAVPADPVR